MGYAGVVNFGGLRIAGLSGIYKRHDYHSGHFEHAPYDDQTKRTAYHSRHIETFRLGQLQQPVDIVLSHDWPRGIYRYCGPDALDALLRQKPHFAAEIADNAFGSPAAEEVLARVRPRFWFAAHHHCKFAAIARFGGAPAVAEGAEKVEGVKGGQAMSVGVEGGQAVSDGVEGVSGGPTKVTERCTRFLALDKCLPHKHYIQFVDIVPSDSSKPAEMELSLDPEWLCVLRATNHLMSISKAASILPTSDGTER